MPSYRHIVAAFLFVMIGMFLLGIVIGTNARAHRPNLPCTCAVGDIFLPKNGEQYICVEQNTWITVKRNEER